jgi:uncharacterized protein
MNKDESKRYYPTVIQAVHLVILYIFIQTVVDFPLALIDYYKDTEYLYHPVKKIVLGVGSTLFILIYGYTKSKSSLLKVFPIKFFNPLIIVFFISFFWGMHNLIEEVNILIEKAVPSPPWFWELFNQIFENDYGFWGAFMKVSVVAPIVEELIFRGLILHGFRRNYSSFKAITISAILFSLFHLNPWQMPATFILGLFLGWLVVRTNSIIAAIIGHSVNNLLVLLSVTYWQEINTHSIFLMEKKNLLSLSAYLVALSVILIYWLTFWPKLKKKAVPAKIQ